MKISGMTEVLPPLSKKQKAVCSIVMGALLVAAGVIILLAGLGVISASAGDVASPAVLGGIGAAFLVSAVMGKNSVSMWIAGVILCCAMPSFLTLVTTAGYANLYPLYIAAPGVGCLLALPFAEARGALIKVAVFFGGLAAVFSLNSSGACGWGVTGGVLAAFVGAWVLAYSIAKFVKKDDDNA